MAGKFGSVTVGQFDSDTELLESGFTETSTLPLPSDDGCNCPHCNGTIDGPADVTITGDAVLCKACGKSILETIGETTQTREDEDAVNRQEWGEAWAEMDDSLEEGCHDYEMGD